MAFAPAHVLDNRNLQRGRDGFFCLDPRVGRYSVQALFHEFVSDLVNAFTRDLFRLAFVGCHNVVVGMFFCGLPHAFDKKGDRCSSEGGFVPDAAGRENQSRFLSGKEQERIWRQIRY
jgi:hypothetical protein